MTYLSGTINMIGMSDVSPMRLTAAIAQKRIREIAEKTEDVILATHARTRMADREIFDVDVFRILRHGHVDEAPELTERGEWKSKFPRNS